MDALATRCRPSIRSSLRVPRPNQQVQRRYAKTAAIHLIRLPAGQEPWPITGISLPPMPEPSQAPPPSGRWIGITPSRARRQLRSPPSTPATRKAPPPIPWRSPLILFLKFLQAPTSICCTIPPRPSPMPPPAVLSLSPMTGHHPIR